MNTNNSDVRGKVITVTSGKGGVGKSTTLANIACALAEEGKKVIAIDFDIGLRNLDMILGLERRIVYDVIDVMDGRANLAQATIPFKKNRNLSFLAASQTTDKNALDLQKVKKLINELKTTYDIILLDSPAGIESGFEHAMVLADVALIIVNPEISAIRDADKIIGIIDSKSEKASNGEEVDKLLVINRYKEEMAANNEALGVQDISELLSIDLLGIIPEESNLIKYTNKGEPIFFDKTTTLSHAYSRIAKRIVANEILNIDNYRQLINEDGFFKKMFNKLVYYKIA